VRHARWRWITDSREWESFETWRAALPRNDRAELEAGLKMVLSRGPQHGERVGDDLFKVYACCGRTVYWIIVGTARPRERHLLMLAWGKNPMKSDIDAAVAEAAKQLRQWRNTP